MPASLRSRSKVTQKKLADPRLLAEVFRGIVAAAVPAAMLGAAGFACGSSGFGLNDVPRCESQSYLRPETVLCSEPPLEQAVVAGDSQAVMVAGDPASNAPETKVAATSCEDRCRASMRIPSQSIQANCNGADEGCCTVMEERNGECYAQCMVRVHQYCGRRPSGLLRSRRANTNSIGAFLAEAAELEAASVTAFDFMARELEGHGAPEHLVNAARRSRLDEQRHTRSMAALARRFGGEFIAPRVRARRARSLRAMAVENAVEGCLREAFGALVATYQAAHAGDAHIRRAMKKIAADETSHAALAFGVATWLEGHIDEKAARAVRSSMRRAGKTLLRHAAAPVDPVLIKELGLPHPEGALKMARGLLDALNLPAA